MYDPSSKSTKGNPGKRNFSLNLSFDKDGAKQIGMIVGGIWLAGVVLLGWEMLWPLYSLLYALQSISSFPPFSWILSPFSWVSGYFSRGAPVVSQYGAMQELRLPQDQVSTYMEHYVQQYGDAALIFAAHDGYPQIAASLLYNADLGYRDLVDATDDNGNTALIYAAAKGYRQCTATLLRSGADPDIANQGGGGRTPLMEAAGIGSKDLVAAIRLSNATVDMVDDSGNTALHYAAYHGHLTVVQELLKGNPRRDIKNYYGHTAASYALSNKFKGIADLLNRPPSKREKAQQAFEEEERAAAAKSAKAKNKDKGAGKKKGRLADEEDDDDEEDPSDPLGSMMNNLKKLKDKTEEDEGKKKEVKHVKGAAEELHKRDADFSPKLESRGISDSERKSLEDQIAKLKRQHEEADLKAQKRIVELLEKSSNSQKLVDDAQREARSHQLNVSEMSLKVQDLESRHKSAELTASEERSRSESLRSELDSTRLEADRHRSRAEGAEKERDLHMEAAKRHEESLKRKHEEVSEHLSRIDRQTREADDLRTELRRKEDEVAELRRKVLELGGSASPPQPTPQPPPPPEAGAASEGVAGAAAAEPASQDGAKLPAAEPAEAASP